MRLAEEGQKRTHEPAPLGYRSATTPTPMAFVVCPTPITSFIPGDAFAGIVIVKALLPRPFAVAVPSNCRGLFQ
jgi:hypothetical protein